MSGILNENAKRICANHIDNYCRCGCPLQKQCEAKPNDTSENFKERMDKEADRLHSVYGW